jgi:hypothetical protein
MKVREVISQLLGLPQDHEVMDEYGENIITGFRVSSYEEGNDDVEYVAYDTATTAE